MQWGNLAGIGETMLPNQQKPVAYPLGDGKKGG